VSILKILNCGRWYKFDKVYMFTMSVFVLIASGCKESGSEFYIPTEAKQCIDYTKNVIQARGEDYAKYTDRIMESGEAVWVAGKKFDFDFVRPAPGISVATFRNEYPLVDKQGRIYPGFLLTMKDSVSWIKKNNPGLIKTMPDPHAQNILIRLRCKMGVVPHLEVKSSVEDVYSEIMGERVSGASIKLNNDIGYYEVHKEKYPFVIYLKESETLVDRSYPPISCAEDGGSLVCSGTITPWNNIVLQYNFPGAQLSDFSRIHRETLRTINLAYTKGHN